MANIQIFTSPEFGDIRTVDQNGEPWFVGKDVAAALGYSNPRDAIAKHVDEQDKGVAICDTLFPAIQMASLIPFSTILNRKNSGIAFCTACCFGTSLI